MFLIFFSTIPHTPRPPLFPYTTLFRSESLRDLIAGTLETYLSVMSNRTNDIMKTLTLVTVMFMPMSFLVGFFGMNFFGESLAFQTPLPKAFLFFGSFLIMCGSPFFVWIYAK